jgi:hypothetical protein
MKSCSDPKIILELFLLKIIEIYNESSEKILSPILENNKVEDNSIEKQKTKNNYNEKEIFLDEKQVGKSNSITEDDQISINLEKMEELKKIRINNALSEADKDELATLKEKWVELASYSIDPFLGPSAGLLLDGNVRVAGKENIIISYIYQAMVDRVNACLLKAEKLLNDLMHKNYKIIAVSEEEWIKIRDVYVGKVRKNEKYFRIEENIDIEKEIYVKNTIKKEKKSVKAAIDLFGENIIEIR